MSYRVALFISFLLFIHNVAAGPSVLPLDDDGSPVAHTGVGTIRGLRAEDGDYAMFMGIPYAEVNKDNPFGHATPYPMFEDTFDAFDDSAMCPQIEEFNQTIVGTLDCLHLNIYVPNNASTENPLPVFVWIYGGLFSLGFAGRYVYGPGFIVRHDVILVTLNYRLGPYGFMCLDIPEVPGNQGFKDQVMALRWIKENIAAFGGDNSRITVAGNSAGAMSVDLHLYYGQEQLFHRIIPQSGVSMVTNVVGGSNPNLALTLAEQFNYTPSDLNDALSFLATIDPLEIIARSNEAGLSYGPCIEKEFNNVEHFITVHPASMGNEGVKEVDVLIGINSDEQFAAYSRIDDENLINVNIVNSLFSAFDFGEEYDRIDELQKIVTQFYLGDDDITEESRRPIVDAASDFTFNHPAMRAINKYLDDGVKNIYLYLFSYSGGRNFVKHKDNVTGGGAAHADELGYLFDISYMQKPLDPEDELIVDIMTELWSNFIKYGNPTPVTSELVPLQWPRVTRDACHYLEINTQLRVSTRPMRSRMAFLDLFYSMNGEYRIGLQREPSAGNNIVLNISLPVLLAVKYFI